MFSNVYHGKRVFVTGHSGFKGSWLTLWLEMLGAQVKGYSVDIPTNPSHIQLLSLTASSVEGDVLDYDNLKHEMSRFQPDIVFHLAAQPLVRRSYIEPVTTFRTNIMGTAHVLEAVRNTPSVKAMVNVTTDKVYQNKERSLPYREDEHLGGYDPYSASKAGSEIVTSSYSLAFFNPNDFGRSHNTLVASARSGNVIGGGDWAEDRLIPDIIRAVTSNKKISVRNPGSTRPWQHVLEPLSGYLLLGKELLLGNTTGASAWNFGPSTDQVITVQEVLDESKRIWPSIKYQVVPDNNFHEANLLQLDSSKAKEVLSWTNVWSYKENIEHTISWYRSFYKNGQVETTNQLKTYIKRATERGLPWTK